MKRILPLVSLVLCVFTQSIDVKTQSPVAEYVPGEVIVQFNAESTSSERAEARNWVRGVRRERLRRQNGAAGELEVMTVPDRAVDRVLEQLRRHPAVRHAEPNWIYRTLETSNDPRYTNGSMWGVYGDTGTGNLVNEYGSQANEAWAAGNIGSQSVVIGVIDEGIQITHPDLVDNIWTNPDEAAGEAGVDDDGNGYVDDLHGWDFVHNDNSVFDSGDGDDHGTHVAGTIGAKGGNAIGVVGVNWNVTLIPAKFLGPGGGSTGAAIKAIDYITDLKARHGLNIVATNNSWGGGGQSSALLAAIVRAANANILFVAAAGNAGANNDSSAAYPSSYDTTAGAGYDAVISVANITSTGALATSSSYGLTSVDLGAPGSNIFSTVPNLTYASYTGTSMATPHVAGAAALYASLNPYASAKKIKEVILASAVATPTPSLDGKTVTGGRLNIGEFAGAAPPPPSAPANLAGTALSPTTIALTWDDTSSNEDAFTVERSPDGVTFGQVAIVDHPSYTDTVPFPGTTWYYQVRAFNRGGNSEYSNIVFVGTPSSAPDADAGADVSVNEGQAVTLNGSGSSHPDNAEMTFSWAQVDGPPVALTGAGTHTATFTAPSVGPAGATLTFSLTASANGVDDTDTVVVTVLNVNTAPEITSAGPLTATEDEPYGYAATATDDDGPLAWSLLGSHTCGGTLDGNGHLQFTPAGPTPPASCVVALEVCDGGTPSLCDSEVTTVTIAAVNDAPVFTSVAPATATEDVPYLYAASADDADGAGQAWSLLPAHTCGGTVTAAGLFSFTPAGPVPPAGCVVALQVCDGGAPSACAQEVAAVTIAAVNDLPSFTAPANMTKPATSADGVDVSWLANGSDPEDGSLPASCTPASGSLFPVGDTTVSCSVTDSSGASAGGTFVVTVTNVPVPGDMKGDGFVRGGDARYQFTFHARENAAGHERARLSVRVDEHGKQKGKKRDDRFESRSVDFMSFSDDPALTAGRKGRTPVDTVLFQGAGEWNGAGGYRYEVFAQDAGEPGRHRESVRVVITKGADVVASFEGELDGGNVQSRRIKH